LTLIIDHFVEFRPVCLSVTRCIESKRLNIRRNTFTR